MKEKTGEWTVMKVKILAGVSGSGKTTYAQRLLRLCPQASVVIVSADDFFIQSSGEYTFNAALLPDAHNACLRAYLGALESGVDLVIVDNTNTTVWEIAPYYALGLAFGAEVELIRLLPPEGSSYKVEWCNKMHQRSVHGVPYSTIWAQASLLEELNFPRHWKVISLRYQPKAEENACRRPPARIKRVTS